MFDKIAIRMLRSCLVDNQGRGEGQRCKVSPAAAHEAVVNGWAEFVDLADAEAARTAFVDEQLRMLARLGGTRWPVGLPRSPWQ